MPKLKTWVYGSSLPKVFTSHEYHISGMAPLQGKIPEIFLRLLHGPLFPDFGALASINSSNPVSRTVFDETASMAGVTRKVL